MNQVGSLKANMRCLELAFLHNILVRRRQLSSPKAETWGRRRGNLCSHAGAQGSGEWARRGFSGWGKSKVRTVQQTGVKASVGVRGVSPGGAAKPLGNKKGTDVIFEGWHHKVFHHKLQIQEVGTEEFGWVWAGPPCGDTVYDHPESR